MNTNTILLTALVWTIALAIAIATVDIPTLP